MKKVIFICVVIAVAVFAYVILSHRPTTLPLTEKDYESGNVGIANPIVEYDNLEEVNQLIGCNIKEYSEASSPHYSIISGEMAQYDFDDKYTVRAMKFDKDISGVYVGNTLVSELCEENEIYSIDDNTFYVYWFVDDMQYGIYGKDVDLKQFTDMYEFFKLS